jgi:tetratricopeptide (TPR) repeat protein
VARRGAGRVGEGSASDAWRSAARAPSGDTGDPQRPAWQPEEWIDEGELRDEAVGAVGRGRSGSHSAGRRRGEAHEPAVDDTRRGGRSPTDELRAAAPANRVERLEARLREASGAFRRARYEDARRILRPLADQVPGAASVRELYGLTLYRLARWSQARRELEAFRSLTGSTEQHPVLADCARALGRYAEVEELWDELRAASPSGELVAEGRIVAAGALADQGRIDEAIRLLEAGSKSVRRAKPHHLRMAYALADLYERAGDLPRARELFARVAGADPDFVDVDVRLRALR